jgi:hypothetical protein
MSFYKGFLDEIMKLGGLGYAWSEHDKNPMPDGNSLLHEQAVPSDVEAKSDRRDFFYSKVMPPEEGRMVTPGKLSTSKGLRDGKRR